MAQETQTEHRLPAGRRWADLKARNGLAQLTHYRASLLTLAEAPDPGVAAVYAGIPYVKTVIITMLISGGLAGMMALNPVLGASARLQVEFVGGAGFVGIAVSLMGRSHPLGIVLAAILFGVLYQGGDALSFDMPKITRDMIVVIQGLVILFAGALEYLFRPAIVRVWQRFGKA